LPDGLSSGVHGAGFFTPKGVEVQTTDAAESQRVRGGVGERTTEKEVDENTIITLEGGYQVVAIPPHLVALLVGVGAPYEASLISSHIAMKPVTWVG